MDDGERSTFACMKPALGLQRAPLTALLWLLPQKDWNNIQRLFISRTESAPQYRNLMD